MNHSERTSVERDRQKAVRGLHDVVREVLRAAFFDCALGLRFTVWSVLVPDAMVPPPHPALVHMLAEDLREVWPGDGERHAAGMHKLAAALQEAKDTLYGFSDEHLLAQVQRFSALAAEVRAALDPPPTGGWCLCTIHSLPAVVRVMSRKGMVAEVMLFDEAQTRVKLYHHHVVSGWLSEDGTVSVRASELDRAVETAFRNPDTHWADGTPKRYMRASDGLVHSIELVPGAVDAYRLRAESGDGRAVHVKEEALHSPDWHIVFRET